jgi:protein-disulfide isomerase
MENNPTDLSRWVDEQLGSLETSGTWQPDAQRALSRIHGRSRSWVRRRWISMTATAACLLLAAFQAPRACATPRGCALEIWHNIRQATGIGTAFDAHQNNAAQVPAFKQNGSAAAPISIEIYSDYECPACAQLFRDVIPPVMAQYVASGKVKIVHRDFPLPMHAHAKLAARYANAAGQIGKYDLVVNQLFQTQNAWKLNGDVASQVGRVLSPEDMQKVRSIVDSDDRVDLTVAADMERGQQAEIRGTPTLIIESHGKRQVLPGTPSLNLLKSYLDSLLSER